MTRKEYKYIERDMRLRPVTLNQLLVAEHWSGLSHSLSSNTVWWYLNLLIELKTVSLDGACELSLSLKYKHTACLIAVISFESKSNSQHPKDRHHFSIFYERVLIGFVRLMLLWDYSAPNSALTSHVYSSPTPVLVCVMCQQRQRQKRNMAYLNVDKYILLIY